MSSSTYRPIITGATSDVPPELLPTRLEFHDFVKDTRQFSLYIQALQSMMKEPYADDFSHVSIGGIHGLPYARWGDSGNADAPGGETFGGYCTHGSVLFPTWHRPYVALFEQSLFAHANKIAGQYTSDKVAWQTAASTLRAPFWDWARKPEADAAVPVEMTSPKVTIVTPKGEETVDNPVYSFTFLAKYPEDTFYAPYEQWNHTLRYPTTADANAQNDDAKFISTYASQASQVRTQTFNMLTRLHSWEYFSNHTVTPLPVANSLESIHDNMHVVIGGPNGHMSDVGVAGFDASFMLHHANVDRLLSLWQALNPSQWVNKGDQPGGTYTIADDGTVDATSDLTPFWKTHTTYWDSNDLRDWKILHYSYPEFAGLKGDDPDAVRKAILQRVIDLYGTSLVTKPTPTPAASNPLPTPAPVAFANTQATVPAQTHDWAVHLKFKKYELGASYMIQVYLGDTFVGSVSAFANRNAERCANCLNNLDLEIEGFVHLNEVLLEKYPDLDSLSPEQIKDVLVRDLKLRIEGRKPDGSVADFSDLPSLKVAPFSQTITVDPTSPLPQLGDAVYHHDVMAGKPGHTPAEQWLHHGSSQ